MDVLAELRRALFEVRARFGGGRKAQKKKKVRAPERPVRTGRKTGCGTGDGGFGVGNNCAKEDGIPDRPMSAGGALKMPNVSKLKKEIAQEKAAAAAAAEKQRRKDIRDKKKAAIARKKAKDQKQSAEKQSADAARAKKRAQMLQKIRIKKANEKLNVAGTPKSVKDQLDEAKASMQAKTAEASKQLTVASTPKSLKQEIEEAKLKKASGALNVVGTPKTVRQELEELKAAAAATKKAKAEQKKAEKEPPQQGVSVGALLQTKSSQLTQQQKDAHEKDKEFLFGAHLKAGWSSGGLGGEKIRQDQKRAISISAAARMDKAGIKESDIDDDLLKETGAWEYITSWSGKDVTDGLTKQGVHPSMHRRYALSAALVSGWAVTSTKSAVAVGVQMAVRDVFKIKKAHTVKLKNLLKENPAWASVADKISKHKAVRAVLVAHHEETQAYFKSKGIKEITLVRGYKGSAKIKQGEDQDVPLQPASSFSMSKATADGFSGSGKTKRLLTVTVPANRVLSMCTTGFGCMHEQELVILGGIARGRLVGKSWDW